MSWSIVFEEEINTQYSVNAQRDQQTRKWNYANDCRVVFDTRIIFGELVEPSRNFENRESNELVRTTRIVGEPRLCGCIALTRLKDSVIY